MKKKTKRDKLREWGLPESFQWHHLRWKAPYEKGIAWYYFSRFIRQRDIEQWGTCISCGREIEFDNCDAGHFMPASSCGHDLNFDEQNVNAECKPCNGFDELHLFGYKKGLESRYGKDTVKRLWDERKKYKDAGTVRDYPVSHYRELAKKYREKSSL